MLLSKTKNEWIEYNKSYLDIQNSIKKIVKKFFPQKNIINIFLVKKLL